MLGLTGCKDQDHNNSTAGVPEDFSFALTWGVYGISSYDSVTGRLVKTTDATQPADYVTYYELTEEDREYIYNLIYALDVDSYPDTYDPGNGMSKPSMTLILTVHMDGVEKTIKADNLVIRADILEAENLRSVETILAELLNYLADITGSIFRTASSSL